MINSGRLVPVNFASESCIKLIYSLPCLSVGKRSLFSCVIMPRFRILV